jgi:hypothetical protein
MPLLQNKTETRLPLRRFWTAVAKRSGDTAFERAGRERVIKNLFSRESGVALRFPPQSKICCCGAST